MNKISEQNKTIREAKAVISSIDVAILKQAGFKLGDPNTHSVKIDPTKKANLDKLQNLLHYTTYLQHDNNQLHESIGKLNQDIAILKQTIHKARVEFAKLNKISEL